MESIEEIRKQRFQFLHRVYKLSEGDQFKHLNMFEIGEELGFTKNLTGKIVQYLAEEELMESRLSGGIIRISHLGICEVEEALSEPDTPTEHFPPVNIIHVDQMISSQIQQSSPGATQAVTFTEAKLDEVKELIQSLKASVDELGLEAQQKSDLQAGIQTIEAQMTSSKPSSTIITESLGSIRRILESAAGSAIASSFLSNILPFLVGSQ